MIICQVILWWLNNTAANINIDSKHSIVYISLMIKQTRLTILIDDKLRAKFKALCANEQTNMSQVIIQYIEELLARQQ